MKSETMPLLAGKVCIVTGAAAGMGLATATLFARYGAQVMLADIDRDAGEHAARDLGMAFTATDVSDEAAMAALVAACVARFGRLDAMVNNAATRPDDRPIMDADLATFDRIVAVNLRSVLLGMKFAFRQMVQQGAGGAVVNIGSVSAVKARPHNAAYVATKHGVIGLTKTGALEMAAHDVRVNAVLPGAIATPMLKRSLELRGATEVEVAPAMSLFGRFGRPDEVAEASAWLCSDAASFVTGETLAVDAGYLIR
jgi:glucose 1-dehydrogenase